jgi:hypothetical protein
LNNFNLSNCLDNVKEEEREYPIQWSLSSKLMNQIPKKKKKFGCPRKKERHLLEVAKKLGLNVVGVR